MGSESIAHEAHEAHEAGGIKSNWLVKDIENKKKFAS